MKFVYVLTNDDGRVVGVYSDSITAAQHVKARFGTTIHPENEWRYWAADRGGYRITEVPIDE